MGRDFKFVWLDPTAESYNFISSAMDECGWGHTVSRHNNSIPWGRYTKLGLANYIAELNKSLQEVVAQDTLMKMLNGNTTAILDDMDEHSLSNKVIAFCEDNNITYVISKQDDQRIFAAAHLVHHDSIQDITEAIAVASRILGEIPEEMDVQIRYD